MKPVEQRIIATEDTGLEVGDCFKCCLASVLELPYEAVPNFVDLGHRDERFGWFGLAQNWLREQCHLALIYKGHKESERPKQFWDGYWIASVTTKVFSSGTHAVVMKWDELVWDPSPFRFRGHGLFCGSYILWTPEPWRCRS